LLTGLGERPPGDLLAVPDRQHHIAGHASSDAVANVDLVAVHDAAIHRRLDRRRVEPTAKAVPLVGRLDHLLAGHHRPAPAPCGPPRPAIRSADLWGVYHNAAGCQGVWRDFGRIPPAPARGAAEEEQNANARPRPFVAGATSCGYASAGGPTRTGMDGNRHPKKAAFLAAFAETGNVTAAAKAADINRTLHYQWLETDADYAKRFEEAREQAVERMEREALRRAVEGWEEPVFHKGEVCGTVRKFSDTLLI